MDFKSAKFARPTPKRPSLRGWTSVMTRRSSLLSCSNSRWCRTWHRTPRGAARPCPMRSPAAGAMAYRCNAESASTRASDRSRPWSDAASDGVRAQEGRRDVRAEHGRLQPRAHALAGTSASAECLMREKGAQKRTYHGQIKLRYLVGLPKPVYASELTLSSGQQHNSAFGISAAR